MEYLADTNVVLRWALEADPLHAVVRSAVIRLRELGHRVAVMLSHGVTRLLTLDPTHFVRFAEIEVLTPQQVARDGAGPQGMPA